MTEAAVDSGEIEFWATDPEQMGEEDDERPIAHSCNLNGPELIITEVGLWGMADIEALNLGQNAPEDSDWVMVERGSRGYLITSCFAGIRATTFATSTSLSTVDDAMALAQEIASTNDVPTIFTKGFTA